MYCRTFYEADSSLGLITVAARSIFERTKSGIVCSNPNQGMGVCVRLFRVCVVLCVGSALPTG
jgi:hypothetical protein